MAKKNAEYKEMAFDTTMRNPERLKEILKVFLSFEGETLNDEVILEIVFKLYQKKIVTSKKVDVDCGSQSELYHKVQEINKTRNSDGGFPKGYQSRFWTYCRTMAELGLIYARYNEEFKISNYVKMFFNNELSEQDMYSIQAIKHNRKNPYRNVVNDFNYFKYIIKLIKTFEFNKKSFTKSHLALSMLSFSGDIKGFYNFSQTQNISNFSITAKRYEDDQNNTNKKRLQKEKSINRVHVEYSDIVLRMLKICGFITLRYKGILTFTINKMNINLINEYLNIDYKISENAKSDEFLYYQEMNPSHDPYYDALFAYQQTTIKDPSVSSNKLNTFIEENDIGILEVENELRKTPNKKNTTNSKFKYINKPLRLEFLIALLLHIKYSETMYIQPNYKTDDIGSPISHAPGNHGDIDVFSIDKETYWLIEVTLIRNKTQQLNNETSTIIRHLLEKTGNFKERYLSFVAPYIHTDTKNFLDYQVVMNTTEGNPIYIKPYDIKEFINVTNTKNNLLEMKKYSDDLTYRFKT